MDLRAAADLKVLLIGVPLPAERPGLLEYAVKQHAEPQLLDALRSLPDRRYESLDEVLEGLVHVQPRRLHRTWREPHADHGGPPGAPAYSESRSPGRGSGGTK